MKNRPHARHKARSLALQALYQWQFLINSVTDIESQYLENINYKKVDVEYFCDLFRKTIKEINIIDQTIEPFLDRKLQELNLIECAVLRISTYELLYRIDIPYKVIINEAIDLTKKFGTIDGYKYINGVLDKVARSVRNLEQK